MIRKATLDGLYTAIFVIGLLNFAAFVSIALILGGDAVNGHAHEGRFYLFNHGELTEVSEAIFRYSYAHFASLWITHPAAIIAALLQKRSAAT